MSEFNESVRGGYIEETPVEPDEIEAVDDCERGDC